MRACVRLCVRACVCVCVRERESMMYIGIAGGGTSPVAIMHTQPDALEPSCTDLETS